RIIRHPPCSPLFPSTTLFRSHICRTRRAGQLLLFPPATAHPPAYGQPAGDLRRVLPSDRDIFYPDARLQPPRRRRRSHDQKAERSEEHTSELQSRGHLVCRPL